FILCLTNLLFILAGLALVFVGTRAWSQVNDPAAETPTDAADLLVSWHTAALVLMVLGVVLVTYSILGFFAALCEYPPLLTTYINALTLVAIVASGLFALGVAF